jgi:serine protease Do
MKRSILTTGLAACLLALATAPPVSATRPVPRPEKPAGALGALSRSFEELAASAAPAVVQIIATGYRLDDSPGAGELLDRRQSSGSGVILDPAGFILTNAHVVAGIDRIQVLLAPPPVPDASQHSIVRPRGRLVEATLVGMDRETDLAVISVKESGLPFLEFGDSDDVRPGQIVLALGSPLGLDGSVTMGVVSAIARQVRPEDRVVYLQTDAPVNPGNSGGPLIDTDGHVVGINTFIYTQSGGSEGVGFAVPSNIALNVYDQIRASGRVRRGMIGVGTQTITPELATGLKLARDRGVLISDVYPGGPAEQAGLAVGDIVLTLDDKPMENARQFEVNLYRRAVGQVVTLGILRAGAAKSITVPVIERPDDPGRFAALVQPDENLIPRLGVLAIGLEPAVRRLLPPLRRDKGVLVGGWNGLAPYGAPGLVAGDVIYALNGQPIADVPALRGAVAALPAGANVVLQVERDGELMFVAVEVR